MNKVNHGEEDDVKLKKYLESKKILRTKIKNSIKPQKEFSINKYIKHK